MKKKIMRGILALIMVCAVVFTAANATNVSAASEDTPTAKYTNWAFNDDFTKVTIDGKVYNNCVVLTRSGTELSVVNLWASYLTNPYSQLDMTPDEFAFGSDAGSLQNELGSLMTGSESKYPYGFELIAINWIPWQETEYKDKFIEKFKMFYDPYHKDVFKSEDVMISYLEDKSNNGLALGILKEKLTKEQAAEKYDLLKMKVTIQENEILKTSDEYLAVSGGGKPWFGNELSFDNISDIKAKMASNAKVSTKTTVVLHLNDPTMSVTKGSETKLVTLEAAPVAPNGTTLVPIRAITEAFGSKVDWLGETKEVVITKGNTTIKLKIGSKTAYVNGQAVQMLEEAQTINSKTAVPLRFVSENMGYKVEWEGSTQKITMTEQR
ncbi:copper amine oxidase-like domain-containing protein [Ruminiclostridium papyrosolvens DSM 2782]|uniref:Copper amine oxidase-like domain-containing protein n=1 Tax=Ruminiclostridium papyrosolvens DSM 2782 TaxID=588581 RepID=F1THF1_9FIRM|nr:copper amine oxidase N-terminal domain-containing protein [Ruminiclostridium papyrosolvens]EGD46154.1 copper amine oxidase-like domain-containing protein [Ruminiclostridium papyrosolvens DSM 2782]WES35938.1 copper amine oxidase N-terminal domain-containing protein [Ruminiclostridium papyrosolvens DSM 2782]